MQQTVCLMETVTENFSRKVLLENTKTNKTIFLACDFNINVLNYKNNRKVENFAMIIFELSMTPTINKPTGVTSYTATAIENIITNPIFDNDYESAIIKTDLFYTFQIIFIIKLKRTSSPENPVEQYMYKTDCNLLNLFNKIYLKHLVIV